MQGDVEAEADQEEDAQLLPDAEPDAEMSPDGDASLLFDTLTQPEGVDEPENEDVGETPLLAEALGHDDPPMDSLGIALGEPDTQEE